MTLRIFASILFVLVGLFAAAAVDAADHNALSDNPPPLANPEQVHLSLGDKPHQMVVTWVTMVKCKLTLQRSFSVLRDRTLWTESYENLHIPSSSLVVTMPVVEYGDSPYALSTYVVGEQTDFVYNGVHRYIHRVTIPNLKPNTSYCEFPA